MKPLTIELRDSRLEGGRMAIQAGTSSRTERDARREIIRQLLDTERGRAIVARLRARKVTIDAVAAAVRSFDLASVEPVAGASDVPEVMLGQEVDAFLGALEGQHRSPQTVETYTTHARGMESAFGVVRDKDGKITADVPVRSVTRSQAEEWLSGKKATTGKVWAAGTQRTAHAVPSQVWDRAIAKEEEIARKHEIEPRLVKNLWRRDGSRKGVRGPRVRKTRVEFLRREEAARLLRSVKGTRYAAWVAVGLYAGLRGGEAANLRVGVDADLTARVVRVQNRKGEHAWSVKNADRGQRTIPMHPRLARWIRAHVEEGYAGEVYLFRQPGKDQPINRGAWRVWTRDAFTAAGIKYGRRKDALVTHSLRHTFASWLTQADVHPVKIAALMGDTVEMVISTYSHLIDQDLNDAIRRL